MPSSRNIERLQRCFGYVRPTWVVCPQGVDDLLKNVTLTRTQVRHALDTPNDAMVIVTVGELDENKNAQQVIEAIAAVRNSHVYAWIIGDGPLREELSNAARKLHVEHRVRLLGYQPMVGNYLAAADVFVSCSRFDTFPNVVLEAMVCRLPVVGPKHDWNRGFSAIDEMCEPGVSALLFDPSDLGELVDCITVLSEDAERRMLMGATARRSTLSRFNWCKHAKALLAIATGCATAQDVAS